MNYEDRYPIRKRIDKLLKLAEMYYYDKDLNFPIDVVYEIEYLKKFVGEQ